MPSPLELSFHVFLLVALTVLAILPTGYLLSSLLMRQAANSLRFLAAYGLGALSLAALVAAGKVLGIPNLELTWVLIFWVAFCLGWFLFRGHHRLLFQAIHFLPLLFLTLYVTILQLITAHPDGNLRRVESVLTRELMSLPFDNWIPYNMSRFIVEDLDPRKLDIVPSWKAGDRGPLGGLVHAAFMLLFGAEESRNWLEGSSGLFFAYQTILSILNGLSLLAVWYIANEGFGRRAAIWAVTMLCGNYFYLMNTVFSWPKFLMAYYVLTAIWMWRMKLPYWLVGGFFAAGMLSHDSALFTFAAFLSLVAGGIIWQSCTAEKRNLDRLRAMLISGFRTFGSTACGFFALMLPWMICKSVYMHSSGRLILMHFFCDPLTVTNNKSFLVTLREYLQVHPIGEVLAGRLYNFFYPLDPLPMFGIVTQYWRDPVALLNNAQNPIFFQVIWAVGILPLIVLLAHYCRRSTRHELRPVTPVLAITGGAIAFITVIAGCPGNTVNHLWSYPLFLSTAIAFGFVAAQGGFFTAILFGLHLALNSIFIFAYLFYHSAPRPFLHGTSGYFAAQLVMVLILLLALSLTMRKEFRTESHP